MSKHLTAIAIAAVVASVAGSAVAGPAVTLNPQPLPPRCVAGAHCPGAAAIRCKAPLVARQLKTSTGKRVWKCIRLKID